MALEISRKVFLPAQIFVESCEMIGHHVLHETTLSELLVDLHLPNQVSSPPMRVLLTWRSFPGRVTAYLEQCNAIVSESPGEAQILVSQHEQYRTKTRISG